MKKTLSILFYFSLISAPDLSLIAQPFPGKIGVNLGGIGGIALELPNATLTAGGWQSIANNGQPATVDAQGWPTEDFRVLFFDHRPYNAWNNAPDDPQKYVVDLSGTYTLSYKGQANLSSWSDAPVQFQNKVYDGASNTTTVDVIFPPGGGANQAQIGNYGFFMINFEQTNYGGGVNGVKEIRMMRPGYQHNTPQIFRTDYLNSLSPFSAMRFMPYLNINSSNKTYPAQITWADRQQPDAPEYTKGAPWEVVIALGNYTGRDIWINIPIDADTDYVYQLATLMKNTLRPDVNIYIEYSNEVWNGGFTQYQYNYDAVLNAPEDADIRASTPYDDRRRARRTAKNVIRQGRIFASVFGVSVASRTRIRPVFAWQIGGWLPWYDDVLNWINSTYGPPKNFIYAIASAPYFNEGSASSTATPQQVVAAMSVSSDSNVTAVKTVAQYANQWQIKHVQYEGGPDNGGGSTTNIANRITANRIAEMKTAIIHNYADNWFSAKANGTAPVGTNDLANYFTMEGGYSRYGCWGATDDIKYIRSNLSMTPKFDALCVLTGKCGNEPTVALTAPANNAQAVVNSPLTISANASDPDGTVKKVEFFVGSTLVGTDSIAPYSISWTPTQTGIIGVLAKSIDNDGKYTFTDANVVNVINATGAHDLVTDKGSISVFPVPAQNNVHVQISGVTNVNATVEVSDMLGNLQIKRKMESSEMVIPADDLQSGVYFLSVANADGGRWVKKIVVR